MGRLQQVPVAAWIFPIILCFGFSVIYFFEWWTRGEERRAVANAFSATIRDLNNKLVFESTQTRSLLKSIKDGMTSIKDGMDTLSAWSLQVQALEPAASDPAATAVVSSAASLDGEPDETSVPEELPAIPEGVMPVDLMGSLNLSEFFADPVFNPRGVTPGRVDWQKAVNMVDRARARIMTLRSDIHLLTIEEMEKMREEGLYVDYEKGQKRHSEKGVYTSGEPLPGGSMRLYSFREEQYPQLYEMRREIESISNETIRRLMALALKEE